MKISVISIIGVFCALSSYSQQESKEDDIQNFPIQVVYLTYGNLEITEALTLSYDRFLLKSAKKINPFIRLGVGEQYHFYSGDEFGSDEARFVYVLNAGILMGKEKHHFEGGVGIVNDFIKNEKYTDYLEASGYIGYRLQNLRLKVPVMFRTGLGYPEGLYIGLGIGF